MLKQLLTNKNTYSYFESAVACSMKWDDHLSGQLLGKFCYIRYKYEIDLNSKRSIHFIWDLQPLGFTHFIIYLSSLSLWVIFGKFEKDASKLSWENVIQRIAQDNPGYYWCRSIKKICPCFWIHLLWELTPTLSTNSHCQRTS